MIISLLAKYLKEMSHLKVIVIILFKLKKKKVQKGEVELNIYCFENGLFFFLPDLKQRKFWKNFAIRFL